MNKFGFVRGKRGPRGFPGEDALKLHLWFPESILELLEVLLNLRNILENLPTVQPLT